MRFSKFQLSVSPTTVVITAIVNATINVKLTIKFNCIVLTTETRNKKDYFHQLSHMRR